MFRRPSSASTLVAFFVLSIGCLPAIAAPQDACDAVAPRVVSAIDDNVRTTVRGTVHPLARAEFDRGAVSNDLLLEHLILVLKRADEREAALQTRIDQMHNQRSPLFHEWLSASEIGQCYGVADADIAQVNGWLEGHGFKIESVANGRMFILFTGTAGQVREAFQTEIHNLDVNGTKHIANISEPQIPEALAPVVAGIASLHDFFPKPLLHPAVTPKHDLKQALTSSSPKQKKISDALLLGPFDEQPLFNIVFTNGNPEWFVVGPQDFYAIYNEKPLLTASTPINGAGQTVAVVEPTDINKADIATFRSNFGLPAYPSTPNSTQGGVNFMFGVSGYCGDPGVYKPDEAEGDLDAEWIGTSAPNAIIDYVACVNSATSTGVELASAYAVDKLDSSVSAISVSYGTCESTLGSTGLALFNNLWQQAAAQGQTVVVSAGDSGDDVCDRGGGSGVGTTGLSVNGLASTPYNVAAGGTDFTDAYSGNILTYWYANNSSPFQSVKTYVPEKAWNNSCGSAIIANHLGVSTPMQVCNDLEYNHLDGGSGGISTTYALPSWQSVYGVGLGSNYTSKTNRNLPDVSMFASLPAIWQHGLVICDSDNAACDYPTPPDKGAAESVFGGTSFVAPQFTGIIALINQAHPSGSPARPTRQGQANYTLYALASAEYGTPSAENTSTSKPSVYTCESNRLALSTYSSIAPSCTFHNINRTPTPGSSSCVGSSNSSCIVETNAEPCITGTVNCYQPNTITYGVYSISTTTFEPAYPQSAGYNAATGLGSVNITNLVENWTKLTPQFTSTTVLAANPTAIAPAASTTLTAAVTATGRGGIAPPMGTVSFYLGTACSGTLLSTSSLVPAANCTTICHATASLAGVSGTTLGGLGSHSATACFTGDGANDAPSHGSVTISVSKTASSTTLISSANPAIVSKSVTFTATVSPAGPPTPTGTVAFTSGGVTISGCSAVALTSSRTAACTTTFSTAGTDSIQATYSGDGSYAASSSTGLSQVVKFSSSVSIASGRNPSTLGTSVIFTATVSPAGPPTPTGTVEFKSNGSAISGCGAVAVSTSRTAQCTTTELPIGTESITAAYSGDTNYLTSTSSALSEVVNKDGSSTSVSSGLNPSTAGTKVTFTATVTGKGTPTVTGTVAFTSAGATITGCSAVSLGTTHTAACSTTGLAVGTEAIVATYSGDSNYQSSASPTLSQTVNKAASTTTLASSANPSTPSESVTFTATITPAGPPTPTGTVAFSANGTTISGCSSVMVSTSRTATCATSFSSLGSDTIKAVYSGDKNYLTSTSAALSQAVKAASTTTVVSSLNPSTAGSSVTFTATIGPSGSPVPTGTVAFTANGTTITGCAAVTVSVSRTAACSTATLATGTDSIRASYNGDSNHAPSSAGLSQVVNKAKSTTTLVSSANPSTAGTAVTFIATVSPAGPPTPTGTVSFSLNGTVISGCSAVSVSSPRTATCKATGLTAATDSVIATYSGDANYLTSTSTTLSQVVNKGTSVSTMGSSANPSSTGQSVTFTLTVTPAGPPTPTGTVKFTANGSTLSGCSAVALSTERIATCATSSLPVGTVSIVGVYSGDSNYATSTSATLSQVVNKVSSTTTMVSSVNPSVAGESVTFTATIAPTGPPTPSGTVAFTANGVAITGCTAVAVSTSRTAACTTSALAAGSNSAVASYSGDANYGASASATLSQVVNKGTSGVTLASSKNPAAPSGSVTLTATITPTGPPTPTGTVSFSSNGTVITGCSAVAVSSSRTAACTTSFSAVGSYSIVASYSGDGNYLSAKSATLTEAVKSASTTTLQSSSNPSVAGLYISLTATVTPAGPPAPTGTVSFTSNGAAIFGCTDLSLSSGSAVCTTGFSASGTYSIKATYSGDNNYLTSTSATLSQVVN